MNIQNSKRLMIRISTDAIHYGIVEMNICICEVVLNCSCIKIFHCCRTALNHYCCVETLIYQNTDLMKQTGMGTIHYGYNDTWMQIRKSMIK